MKWQEYFFKKPPRFIQRVWAPGNITEEIAYWLMLDERMKIVGVTEEQDRPDLPGLIELPSEELAPQGIAQVAAIFIILNFYAEDYQPKGGRNG
jgi:hypothetical protein